MRRTPRPIVAELKRSITPSMFYGRMIKDLAQKKNSDGWVCGGLCPFHPDKRAGNFRVNLDTGGFICFSCDASGGDIIDFVRRRQGSSFRGALEHLMREFGVRL